MSDDNYRGLSRDKLILKCRILEIRRRTATQETEQIMNLVLQHPAAAAGEADARALPAPVACGSGQLVRAPQEATAPSGPSVGRSAPRLDDTPNAPVYRRRGASGEHQGSMPVRDRRPGMERSVHTRTRANRDRATCTPIDLGGTDHRNATRAGAAYTGTNPHQQASAQAQASALPDAGNRFDTVDNHNPRKLLLCKAGVNPSMAMTPEDLNLAKNTPDITPQSFNTLFGGNPYHERPKSKDWNILCVNRKAQPFAPHSPGKSGLVFFNPDIVLLEDMWETFHLFLKKIPKLSRSERQIHYLGTYTKVPIVHATVEPNEWLSLPKECSEAWLHRIESRKGCARTRADIKAAFSSREEKLEFEVIKYVRYDHDIATRLQTTLLQGDLA